MMPFSETASRATGILRDAFSTMSAPARVRTFRSES
jgi:hypothetical protein